MTNDARLQKLEQRLDQLWSAIETLTQAVNNINNNTIKLANIVSAVAGVSVRSCAGCSYRPECHRLESHRKSAMTDIISMTLAAKDCPDYKGE